MREGFLRRETTETTVTLSINLDQPGNCNVNTGIGFFDHMLHLFAFRAGISLDVKCEGDLHIDDHHSVEDVGIVLGQVLNQALGGKRGIARYGTAWVPMDESLAHCVLDISGRGFLVFNAEFTTERAGDFSTEMTEEFFRAFAVNAGITLHINLDYGRNTHHMIEAIFKAFGLAIKQAIRIEEGGGIPSTKGLL